MRRLTIEDAHKAAKRRGGKCLSKRYISIVKKLEWQCSKGHIWKTTFKNIKRGTWCRKCRKIKG